MLGTATEPAFTSLKQNKKKTRRFLEIIFKGVRGGATLRSVAGFKFFDDGSGKNDAMPIFILLAPPPDEKERVFVWCMHWKYCKLTAAYSRVHFQMQAKQLRIGIVQR